MFDFLSPVFWCRSILRGRPASFQDYDFLVHRCHFSLVTGYGRYRCAILFDILRGGCRSVYEHMFS